MARQNLTVRKLDSLKAAPKGKRLELPDSIVPGLTVRVTAKGVKTFCLVARYPGSDNPTRRALGTYGAITLDDAREKARTWHELLRKGIDPKDEEERQRLAELRKKADTFEGVAEEFIKYIERQKLRTAPAMARDLRNYFGGLDPKTKKATGPWKGRPITEITSGDIRKVIGEAVNREAPYTAFKLFALIRRLFNWAIGTDDYGLAINPCQRLKSRDLIGERHARSRILNDVELRAFWRATGRMGYPYGPLYRLLALTSLRLNSVCGARWSELDLEKREWKIPPERMKKIKGGAKPFLVPLTDAMIEVLDDLPRFDGGDCLFSNSYGKRPFKPSQFSDPKERLDALMIGELRKLGDGRATLPPFVNHDIRRTVRTGLSALKISEEVREAVLAHVRPGIKGVYDLYEYRDEKQEALTLWNARLRSIVEPPPANVVELRAQAVARA